MRRITLSCILICFLVTTYAQQTTSTATSSISLGQTFRDYVMKMDNNSFAPNTTSLKSSFVDDVEGSPYFFNKWVSGKIYLKNNMVLPEPGKLLNFDKMTNELIIRLSGDNSKILNVDMKDIDKFMLDDSSKAYSFIRDPKEPTVFMVEQYADSDYTLYKKIGVKFFKADYENKGLYETGHKYDRYVDENTYYLKPKNGDFILINGTKKELKKMREAYPQAKQVLGLIHITSS